MVVPSTESTISIADLDSFSAELEKMMYVISGSFKIQGERMDLTVTGSDGTTVKYTDSCDYLNAFNAVDEAIDKLRDLYCMNLLKTYKSSK
jgi:hypothetical protein